MRKPAWKGVAFGTLVFLATSARADDASTIFADQGSAWSAPLRAAYYVQDQGSRLIPLAWLQALEQPGGAPFLTGSLARYGYLPTQGAKPVDLPIGFTVASAASGPTVGMTCAACHTREITVADKAYRIDGGPTFADFGAFVVELDTAMLRALASEAAFGSFASRVLGVDAKPEAVAMLHKDVALWSLRFHMLIDQSVPKDRAWGPARVDAIGMIYNHLSGLDLGPAPTYVIPGNMAVADAPTRYPFLWNAGRQDRTQWGGFAANGNDNLALARNLGQVFGVFGAFHPEPKSTATPLDRDYLAANSAKIQGIATAEGILARLGAPVWPFPVDHVLAEKGKAVFERPMEQGGCVQCHGVSEGDPRPPTPHTWKTPILDAGTDMHQWHILLRSAKTGTLEGARVPGVAAPLGATDLSLNILKAVVVGTLVQTQAAQQPRPAAQPTSIPSMPKDMSTHEMALTMHVDAMPSKAAAMDAGQAAGLAQTFVYEARVLNGIWAAAPYLHNGSVADLADLLKPSVARRKNFAVGPAYNIETVGLAGTQPTTKFVLKTTGCEDRASGDSNCGHEYGTSLPDDDKRALLEYLKTL